MPWHPHSDADINTTSAPQPAAKQKQASTTSAAGSAASGIGQIGSVVKGIVSKVKSSKAPKAGGSYDSGD